MSRLSRQGQIFHSVLIDFISPVAEASLGDFHLSGIFGNATIADCRITVFNDFESMDCVEIVLDVDKPLGAL